VISAIKGKEKKARKKKGKQPRKGTGAAAVAPAGSSAEDAAQFIYAFVTGLIDRCRSQIR
jgi:predicted Abi (CAAX) family protease